MAEWQPIETAPKDGTRFDAWCEFRDVCGEEEFYRKTDVRWRNGRFVDDRGYSLDATYGDGSFAKATHWMPLPDSPHAVEGGQ